MSDPLVSGELSLVHTSDRHQHKDKINRKTKPDISSGTCKDKTTRIFLCFIFRSALGLCLDYDLTHVIATILTSQA